MPSVYNGCGTWYYGQRNVQQYSGYCQACQATRTLTSYDTRLYVVLVMIPIFPLGRKRIIDKCGTCSRHRAMPLLDWQQAQARTEELMTAYRKSPHEANLARDIVETAVSYRNVNLFKSIAPDIERNLKDDTDVLRLLAGANAVFHFYDEYERLLRRALEIKPDDQEVREELAGCLLTLQRPADAEPYLSHIVEQILPDRVQYVYALAQVYQAQGNHDKALQVFAQCEQVHPMLARNPDFEQLRTLSQKHLGTHVPVVASEVERQNQQAATRKRVAGLAAVASMVGIIGYGAAASYEGSHREVFVVSGLGRPYQARLNGTLYTLHPHEVVPIQVAEGPVTVEGVDAPLPPQTLRIETPFWSRPIGNETFVINPDQCAVVSDVIIYYGTGGADREPHRSFGLGQSFYRYRGIDFPFAAFSHSVTSDSHAAVVSREGLSLVQESGAAMAEILMQLADQVGKEPCAHAAAMHLTLDPGDAAYEYLDVLRSFMKPADLEAFMRPQLERRPVQTDWHRAYQDSDPPDVEKTYAALLARDAANGDLMYLAGRASTDLDRSLQLCRQGISTQPPSAYAANFLASYDMSNALYDEAVRHATQAAQWTPSSAEFRSRKAEALLAAGHYDAASQLMESDTDFDSLRNQAYALMRAGRDKDVAGVINRLPPGSKAESAIIFADLAYAAGLPDNYVTALSQSPVPWARLTAHMTGGDLQKAEDDLQKTPATASYNLLLSLCAAQQHDTAGAARHLDRAVQLLAAGTRDERTYAAALQGTAPFQADLLRLVYPPEEKSAILVVLGSRNPAHRQDCFALARKLNYDKRFPYLLLKKAMDETPVR